MLLAGNLTEMVLEEPILFKTKQETVQGLDFVEVFWTYSSILDTLLFLFNYSLVFNYI